MNDWGAYIYLGLLLLSVVITTSITIYAWRQRQVASAAAFARMLACGLGMLWGALFRNIISPTSWLVEFFHALSMLSVILTPPFWLFFTLDYSGHNDWLTRRRMLALNLIPAMSTLILLTNPLHSWFYRDIVFERIGFVNVFYIWEYAPWFYVHSLYGYALMIAGTVLLIRFAWRAFHLYRLQVVLLILGAVGVLIPNLLATLKITSLSYMPVGFMVMALLYGQAIFRYRLLNLAPVARHTLVDSMSDGMLVVDDQGKIVDVNPAMAQFLEIAPEAAIGQPVGNYLPSGVVWVTWLHATASVQDTLIHDACVYDVRVAPLYDRGKRISGRMIVLHDITERQQAAEALERYAQELEARNAELDAFAHTVAHDLKNPLSAVVGYGAYLISRYAQTDDEQRLSMLNIITRQGKRMSSIIDELLLLASLRKSGGVVFSALNMGQIVAEVQERLALVIEEKHARIIAPETWPVAVGYAAWVEEIWANYLSNALKYGGTPPHVELGYSLLETGSSLSATSDQQPASSINFWVRDNGAGLSAEEQARLFTPFTRLDQISAKGHGLGLSIVYRISQKLGGEVGVSSAPGEGCMFWFTLPAAEPLPDGEAA